MLTDLGPWVDRCRLPASPHQTFFILTSRVGALASESAVGCIKVFGVYYEVCLPKGLLTSRPQPAVHPFI